MRGSPYETYRWQARGAPEPLVKGQRAACVAHRGRSPRGAGARVGGRSQDLVIDASSA